MTPYLVLRDVATKEQTFTISGFVQFATDAQALFGNRMEVVKEVKFTPKENEIYSIEGELSEGGSKIWIRGHSWQHY